MVIKDLNNIALLIFALSPEAEGLQKNLSGEKKLYALLNQQTLKLAKGLGIPYYHFTEKEQQGNTFGERYTQAIKEIFSKGYDGIITIGNDSPGLTSSQLQTAYQNLLCGNSILGPSFDGGFYLLAMSRSSFSEEAFLSISWKSAFVFRQMRSFLEKSPGRLIVLDPLCDLDTHSDIASVLDTNIKIPLGIKKALIQARKFTNTPEVGSVSHYYNDSSRRILNRGSPLFAA